MKAQALAYSFLLIGSLALLGTITTIIAAWHTIVLLASAFVWVLFTLAACGALALSLWLLGKGATPAVELLFTIYERKQSIRHAETRLLMDERATALHEHLALTRVAPDERGNYSVVLAETPFTRITPGNAGYPMQIARTGKTAPDEQPLQGNEQRIDAPDQQWLMGQLEENALLVSPGVRASNGQIVTVSIVDVPHFKIIGSTGFGKSCLAAALIDQAMTINTPDVLQVALLDLEHKTSRLFENRSGVAEVKVGRRNVPLVATTPDEVAKHLGYLKLELDRRTRLAERDLAREAVLLIYVEEMLALQYELVDEKILSRFFADLTILAVRGRKYGMFLMTVMQTDYSVKEMQTTQKMFRFRCAAGIDITTARAAGFINSDLVKHNFTHATPGQFVIEYPSFSDVVLAPRYDVKALLNAAERDSDSVPEQRDTATPDSLYHVRTEAECVVNASTNDTDQERERASQAGSLEQSDTIQDVLYYHTLGWGKQAIVEKVWHVKKGGSARYKNACTEYDAIIDRIEQSKRS